MPIPIEPTIVIDYPHYKVHKGVTLHASYKSPEGGDVADNSSLILAILTGVRKCHLTFECAAGGDAEILFYEGAALSANGTNLFSHNMDRATSIFTPSTAVTHTPSITTSGLLLHNSLIPGGITGGSTGAISRTGTEWILRPSTIYLVQLVNRGGNAQPLSISTQWYEVEG